jgi:hypothetical protein
VKSYKSHKVVQAAKIIGIDPEHLGHFEIALDDGTQVMKTDAWQVRFAPTVGSYYVVYDDGYASVSPAAAFEAGYTEVMANGLTEAETLATPSVAGLSSAPATTTFQDRVRQEHRELSEKTDRLATFVSSGEPWQAVAITERRRLLDQLQIMRAYAEILRERIAAFDPAKA